MVGKVRPSYLVICPTFPHCLNSLHFTLQFTFSSKLYNYNSLQRSPPPRLLEVVHSYSYFLRSIHLFQRYMESLPCDSGFLSKLKRH
ncbi:hypothetical protein O181_038920 [Austropuccinia psidii MF-1]|uniref:Uncharacterized protein n=1 Tax=Austropuccinia psidii MF-1 TaxID=1389203 RepID=A0A9Q3DDV0_9BASI|nr:hypothetical protein [Austropuccinia psidii MF-1]